MAFESEKQRRYMQMHHPSIAKRWENEYKNGGKVKKKPRYYAEGGFVEEAKESSKKGDVVNAKLSLKEVVLNWEQMQKLENLTGMKAENIFSEIGVPGFKGGEYAGGGVAGKEDALMQYYENGALVEAEPKLKSKWGEVPDVAGLFDIAGVKGGGKETPQTFYDFQKKHRPDLDKHHELQSYLSEYIKSGAIDTSGSPSNVSPQDKIMALKGR